MKTSKFWITAVTTVATAGMIGVAIAQNSSAPGGADTSTAPRGPNTPAPGLTEPNAASMNTANATSGAASSTTGTGTGSNMSADSTSPSSDAGSNTLAQADRG